MSFQAMTWAVEQELPAMQKIVLLMLANRTNHDTGLCYPSHDTLAKECGMDKRSVIRQIESLEKAELLTVVRTKKSDGSNNPNHYHLNLKKGGSDTKSPETGTKPITITTTRESNFFEISQEPKAELTFDGLPPDQIECYNWAKHHNYWHFATESVHKFLTIYTKPKRDGLKAQFDAHKKALEDERSQTGLNGNQKNITGTGANYATHYPTNKPLTATQRRENLRRLIDEAEQRERFDNSTIIDADAFA